MKSPKKKAKKTTTRVPKDIDKYLAHVPEPARSTLEKVRQSILAAAPQEATECISYGIPTIDYKGHLVAFAAFKKHCSLFPMSKAVIAALKEDLKGYPQSTGTIQFPQDKPLSAALIRKIVNTRLAEKKKSSPD